MNSVEPSIQFTVEQEENGCLPFLDVLLRRTDNGLAFSVHRKATHTGQYLNFASCHPVGHKTSVVSSLVTRAKRICTGEEQLERELKKIRQELSQNGYPRKFTKKIEQRILSPAEDAPRRTFHSRAAIPYVAGVSEALSRVFSNYDLRVAHVPCAKLRGKLVNAKDKLPKEKYPGVIYKIPCGDCDCVYVGETGKFPRRLKEHQRDVNKKNVTANALAEHVETHNHQIDWDSATIIAKERNATTRLLVESLVIQTTSDTINRTEGNMPGIYARSLRRILKA